MSKLKKISFIADETHYTFPKKWYMPKWLLRFVVSKIEVIDSYPPYATPDVPNKEGEV